MRPSHKVPDGYEGMYWPQMVNFLTAPPLNKIKFCTVSPCSLFGMALFGRKHWRDFARAGKNGDVVKVTLKYGTNSNGGTVDLIF